MREVRMTFGEHLEELRKRIFLALLWLAVAVALSFVYGKDLLEWTMGPHKMAILGAVRDHSIAMLLKKGKELEARIAGDEAALSPSLAAWDSLFASDLRRSRIAGSLRDLVREVFPEMDPVRQELLWKGLASALGGVFTEESLPVGARSLPERFRLLEEALRRTAARPSNAPVKRLLGVGGNLEEALAPLARFNRFLAARRAAVMEAGLPPVESGEPVSELVLSLEALYEDMHARARTLSIAEPKLPIAISYLESFMTYFKVALVFGLFFATPLILYEMWKFVGAGLYPNEQRYVLIFLPFSVGLFVGGALFGYFSVIPVALEFLAGWGAGLVELNFTISNYVGLFFTLTVLLGLVFQTPLVMVFLGKIGAVGAAGFRKARKWAMMGAVLVAAIVTPPDPLSWMLVAGPMIVLYELGILIVAAFSRKKAPSSGEKQVVAT